MKQIIAIFGVPRTGTSWLGEIFNSSPEVIYKLQPLFSYAFKDYINVRSSAEEMIDFFEKLEVTQDDFLDCTDMRAKGKYPVFKKYDSPKALVFKEVRYLYLIPHLLETFPDIKIVMIERNIVDTLNSWINAPREYKKEWDIEKEWYFAQSKNEYKPENYYGYAKWKEARLLFKEMKVKYPDNTIIVKYEELCNDSLHETEKLYEFCDLKMNEQTKQFLNHSQHYTVSDAYAVYRKKEDIRQYQICISDSIKEKIKKDLEITSSILDFR